MLDVAIRRVESLQGFAPGSVAIPWPAHPSLAEVLPGGLRRGSSMSVAGSLSLLLAVLGGPSGAGAWCALVGMPRISAEAAVEYGVELSRLPVITEPGRPTGQRSWATMVGALLDTVDVVVARPPARVAPADVQRLAARARSRDAVLIAYLPAAAEGTMASNWPAADLRLEARDSIWEGADNGSGRLANRRLTIAAEGRGRAARPVTAGLQLPASGGGLSSIEVATAQIVPLSRVG